MSQVVVSTVKYHIYGIGGGGVLLQMTFWPLETIPPFARLSLGWRRTALLEGFPGAYMSIPENILS